VPPIIDFSAFADGADESLATIAREIGRACRDIGFFYLRGHAIEPPVMRQVFDASRRLFELPAEAKASLAISAASANRGYVGLRTESLDPGRNVDDKEAFNIGVETAAPNHWPEMPGFRETMLDYFNAVWRLGRDVHKAFALDLGLDRDYFESRFDNPMAMLRLLHYPPAAPRDDGVFGAGEHTDYGNLTLLLTDDAGGLEVRRRDGSWMAAPYVPRAFVCNIGDCLMRWTNDVYVSTPHRVVNPPGRDRYSIAFFLDANADALVEAIPACISPSRPARYAPITAGDYLASRLAATYGFKKDITE
jgi:isopenicillin N synthase-like dioxygenase